MGMYNEVFDECPQCGKRSGYLQISQLVLGFGEFDIADLAYLKKRYDRGDLTADDLQRLAAAIEGEVFCCRADRLGEDRASECHHSWRPDPAKIAAIRLLPRLEQGDTAQRAVQLLREAGLLAD